MKRETAAAMMSLLCSPEISFASLDELSMEIEDEVERVFVRRKLGAVAALLGYDLVMHIVRQYPELDPDKKALSA